METPSDFFASWMQTQQQAFNTLREQMQQAQAHYQNFTKADDNPFAQWSKAAFAAFSAGADATLAKDTFSKTLQGSDAMQKLYELWQPLLDALRDKSFDPATFSEYADPQKTAELVGKLFRFDVDAMSQWQKQWSQYVANLQQYGKPWLQAATGDASAADAMKQMQGMFDSLHGMAGKLFNAPAIGKDREQLERISHYAAAMADFTKAGVEYQQLMQETGQQAMQAVIQALADKLQAGEKVEKFTDFFNLWIEVNEKHFNKLFQSKAFAYKRNAVTDAGFKARKLYHALVEEQLAELPIARRSEMDELYKTIYELRKQVKSLQSQINQLADAGAKK